jgi:hypothetical protein
VSAAAIAVQAPVGADTQKTIGRNEQKTASTTKRKPAAQLCRAGVNPPAERLRMPGEGLE